MEQSYTIVELNKLLSDEFNIITGEMPRIRLTGEIVECKLFKHNCGIGFKIRSGSDLFTCKAWSNKGINVGKIKSYENTNCIVIGHVTHQLYMSRFEFLLELCEDVINENSDSKIKKLKEECEMMGYFENKKRILWENVKKIGIISKKETQGYNDFVTQFKVPMCIILKEIALEGETTPKSVIKSIREFQEEGVDFIIIIRGGGSTIDISNSFDRLDIFEIIKESAIPIITAIGHEADKDDKLLITSISDYDYPTPTRAALELNKIFIDPLLAKLENYLDEVKDSFYKSSEREKEKEYMSLKCLFERTVKIKFGGRILSIEDGEEYIIIQRGDEFFRNTILFADLIDITKNDIELKILIQEGIDNEDISVVKENIKLFTKDILLSELIDESIKKIETIEKLEDKFESSEPKQVKSVYCKQVKLDKLDSKKLIQLHSVYLWYIEILEALNAENSVEIREIIEFCKLL
jgi:exodeoxyribonuclease VII large subunit